MPPRSERLFLILLILANAAAVLLFSGAEPVATMSVLGGGGGWHRVLALFADLFTLPIPTEGIADVRDAVMPVAAGVALLLMAASSPSSRSRRSAADSRHGGAGTLKSSPTGIVRYLFAAGGAVLLIAILSAAVNDSFDLSWGWIVRFAAGGAWAILIASTIRFETVRRAWTWLLVIGLVSLILTIAHRADRGYAHFTWPIGPITPTAALAAVWAAMSAAGLAVSIIHRRWSVATVLVLVVLGLSAYVLLETQRRAPAIGLAGAILAAGAVLILHASRTRTARITVAALLALAVAGCGGYIAVQYRNRAPTASGPVALRFELLRLSAGVIADRPSLGAGPDGYVTEMTNAVAPLRAVSPHFYHGNIDTAAHNEWIQATVELGVPGALFYAAIPIGVLLAARRRFEDPLDIPKETAARSRAALADRRAVILSLAAGLLAILITEAGSINLRVSILPVWYWTLIGLLAACGRSEPDGSHPADARPVRARGLLYAVAGLALLAATYVDVANACVSRCSGSKPPLFAGARLFAEKTLTAWSASAQRASVEADRRRADASRADAAVSAWRRLYERIPGWSDVPARYAAALLAAGSEEQGRHVLTEAIGPGLNPYQAEANVLYALHATDDPAEKFRCVQRGLRNSRMTDAMHVILRGIGDAPGCEAILRDELPAARAAATVHSPPDADDLAIELLRISAFLQLEHDRADAAISDQRLAAAYAAHLEKNSNRYRRAADAETDVFHTLARMIYERRPANYREAFEAIRAAEYYAVLGIKHEHVADPRPELGYVGGIIVPTELPERLFPLWERSALLHVIAGHEELLDGRILSYCQHDFGNPGFLDDERCRLYLRAHEFLEQLPPPERPAHFESLNRKREYCIGRRISWDGVLNPSAQGGTATRPSQQGH